MSAEYDAALEVKAAVDEVQSAIVGVSERLDTLIFLAALALRGKTPMGTRAWHRIDALTKRYCPDYLDAAGLGMQETARNT